MSPTAASVDAPCCKRSQLAVLSVRIACGYVPRAVGPEHLARIGHAAEANTTIGTQVLMHACYFPAVVVAVCKDLTTSAVRFARQWRRRMTIRLKRLVKIAIERTISHIRVVEHLAKTINWDRYDGRWFTHA